MPDSGQYLIDWLDRDLAAAIRPQQSYTNNGQFKSQFLPTTPAMNHEDIFLVNSTG